MSDILKIYGKDYKNMTITLLKEGDVIRRLPERDKIIGIKPNLVSPTPAFLGATTHTEIVEGVITFLKDNGYENILVMEGSWVGDTTQDAFDVCGYNELAKKLNVALIDLQQSAYIEEEVEGLTLRICKDVKDIDYLINIPVLKGHCQTKITCALKNMKGVLPNSEKRHFHAMGLHKPIGYLNKLIHQDLIIVDHICGDLDFEDGGNPVSRDCIMLGYDPVLVDSYVCRLLGYSVDEVPYIGVAESLKVGTSNIDDASVERLVEEGSGFTPVKDDEEVMLIHRKAVDIRDRVMEVDSCSACYGTLIPALDSLREEGILEGFNETIAIGQGYRGKTGCLGVGNCTAGFDFSIKGCPPTEEDIKEGLRTYIKHK